MDIGDYYDEDWNYIGNDGKDDDKVYQTTSENVTNSISESGEVDWDKVNESSTYLGIAPEVFVTWDNITNTRILGLDPAIRGKATQFINNVESTQGIQLRISDGYRSIEEQNALYNSGKGVTNAKGGFSYHNYGLAIDVVIMKGKKALIDTPISKTIGSAGKALGFEWGGDWKKVDFPHFQMTFGRSIKQLREANK